MSEKKKCPPKKDVIPPWFLDSQGQIGCTPIGGNPPLTLPRTLAPSDGAGSGRAWWPEDGLGGDYELLPWSTRPV